MLVLLISIQPNVTQITGVCGVTADGRSESIIEGCKYSMCCLNIAFILC